MRRVTTLIAAAWAWLKVAYCRLVFNSEPEDVAEDVAEGYALGQRHGLRGGARQAYSRGQSSNLVQLMMGVMIAGIVALNVFIPVINDAESNANLTSSESTIVGLLTLFAALLLLVSMAGPIMSRV